jgi:hypothetical protein
MVPERRATPGYLLAVLGSIGLTPSLWQLWYSFRVPGYALDQAVSSAGELGVLAPFIRQGAELLRTLTFHVTAWQAYTTIPAVLLIVGVIGGGLSLLALAGSARGVARLVSCAGAVGVAAVLYRVAVRPAASDVIHIAWGLYLALAAAAAIVAGGLLAAENDRARSPARAFDEAAGVTPAAWSTAHSTAPPGP